MNDIKARMKSVRGTMQITKAMELVATSKLRHAKERAESSRPYIEVAQAAIAAVSAAADIKGAPWSEDREGKTLYIVIAGDRGLAGGYNSNIFKLAARLDESADGIYLPIGKKASEYYERRGKELYSSSFPYASAVGVGACLCAADEICKDFLSGKFARVVLVYTKFVSMMAQTPVFEQLLPLSHTESSEGQSTDPIYEEDPEELLTRIVPMYLGGILHCAACESVASECGARRSAMNSANKNAEEMIDALMLRFNRARQAVITQEITEIVSGAEAL